MTRLAFALVMAMGAIAWGQTGAAPGSSSATDQTGQTSQVQGQAQDGDKGLVIEPEELPGTYPYGTYLVNLHVQGNYVPVLHWRIEKGALPAGITLDESGVLRGAAEHAGEFQFVVSVRDGDNPQRAVQRAFVIKVTEAMTLEWGVPAHVTGNRIDGTVAVSNTTADDLDLTFDVKAVAENGRATEIGYQHFPMKRGTIAMALPFGDTLPHGAYVIYVNLVGEVAKRNVIYRQRMQSAKALQVLVEY
jgi:hypothetical protein